MEENIKQQFLDQDGLEELISLIKAADNAIEAKMNSLIWSGTKAEYEIEIAKPDSKITEDTVVIITDDEEDSEPITAETIQNLFNS